MDSLSQRPKLIGSRVISFFANNSLQPGHESELKFKLNQEINLSLGTVERDSNTTLRALVQIDLSFIVLLPDNDNPALEAKGQYESALDYREGVCEEDIRPLFETEDYQYILVAQTFPLAMRHFKEQIRSMGFDAKHLPCGI